MARRVEQPLPDGGNESQMGIAERLHRMARGLGVALAILVFWTGGFLLAWLVVPAVMLRVRDRLERRRRMQRLVAASWRWFHRMLETTTLYRYRYTGLEPPEGPAVVIANHPSLLDVTSIICRMPHVCCVVKSSLVDSPLVGRLLKSCGHVGAGDGSLMGGAAVLDALRARIDEGFPVLVFPEGTRSPKGGLHKFRRGAFEVARTANVPVVPLFLRCTPPALGKGTPVWEHPKACPTLEVHVDDPIDMTDREPRAACQQVEADFRRRLSDRTSDLPAVSRD